MSRSPSPWCAEDNQSRRALLPPVTAILRPASPRPSPAFVLPGSRWSRRPRGEADMTREHSNHKSDIYNRITDNIIAELDCGVRLWNAVRRLTCGFATDGRPDGHVRIDYAPETLVGRRVAHCIGHCRAQGAAAGLIGTLAPSSDRDPLTSRLGSKWFWCRSQHETSKISVNPQQSLYLGLATCYFAKKPSSRQGQK